MQFAADSADRQHADAQRPPAKIAFLEQVGFQRVILARELGLEQIRQIHRRTKIELECFIHGSLCVCYSGQCYLSYALGGRSGNRGQCAQPCRKAYTLVDGNGTELVKKRHLLSLRDLNLTDYLRDLIEAGVCSFKIEGRLKDSAYITNVVSHYRAALDAVLEARGQRKSSSGRSIIDFAPNPEKTFNRGYTSYCLNGRDAVIASPDTPKMMGEAIGMVTAVTPRSFTTDAVTPLHNGDGLCFFDRDGELRGTVVNAVQGQQVLPEKMEGIEKGMRLFRNHDHQFLTSLAKSQVERTVGVALTLRETAKGFTVLAEDEDGVTAQFTLPSEKALAEKPEQAVANIRKQLSKVGGTIFACPEVDIELTQTYFLPVAMLNALRRGVLEALADARAARRPMITGRIQRNQVPYPERALTFRGNVLNRQAELFYRRHGVSRIAPAAETGIDLRDETVMTTKLCLRHELGCCPKAGAISSLLEPLTLIDEKGHQLELRFACARCEMEIIFRR